MTVTGLCVHAAVMNVAVGRMHDMAEQISQLTEAQQLYQDAISLKERELSVCAVLLYEMTCRVEQQWLNLESP